MSDTNGSNDGSEDAKHPPDLTGQDPYADAADRLERVIDQQISIVNGIDDKSEHITRLVGVLIGLVFTVLSLIVNFDSINLQNTSTPTEISFIIGILSLLVAMAAAIVTYLSSKFFLGLDHSVGEFLSHPAATTDFNEHIKRVNGSYAWVIKRNKSVIEVNSKRFRRSLFTLLTGVLFLANSGILYFLSLSDALKWGGLFISIAIGIVSGWYILGGKYLTLNPIEDADDKGQ